MVRCVAGVTVSPTGTLGSGTDVNLVVY